MGRKIWIMNHYATNSFYNKGGRHYWFAQKLREKGYQPTVFCANVRHNTSDQIDVGNAKYIVKESENIPFVFVKTSQSIGNGLDRVNNMLGFYRNLFPAAKEYARRNGIPDVILASSVHPLTLVAGIKIAKKIGVPCICEIRDLWPEAIFAFNKLREKSLLGRMLIHGEHWIYKNADALIFTKEGDTDYLKERKWDIGQGGAIDLNKAHYINNGVDNKAFAKSISVHRLDDLDLETDNFNVVYTGTVRPVNNVGKIVDAAAIVKDEHPDIQFLIYGDGNMRESLEKRIEEDKLTNIKMKGYVEKQYIPYILSKSSVNLLNYSQSQYNWSRGNSSNKLFEYMASGKPVISTVKMGYSIIRKYNCGLELENASAKDLADAIITIKEMPKGKYDELGKNAKSGALDFDYNALTDKLIEVINSVAQEEEAIKSAIMSKV